MNEAQLKDKIVRYFTNDLTENITVTVTVYDTICRVHLIKDYDGIAKYASFTHMKWLSKLLGTDKIDIEDAHHNPSRCDTCDWGSSDELEIVCQDISIELDQ